MSKVTGQVAVEFILSRVKDQRESRISYHCDVKCTDIAFQSTPVKQGNVSLVDDLKVLVRKLNEIKSQ